jgi:putative tricarboxylic transport membrane protein
MTVSTRLTGLPVVAVGLLVAAIASGYPVGTPARMGPGFVPLWAGIVLALIGILILIVDREPFESEVSFGALVRPTLMIFAALILWGMTVRPFGLIPATLLLVVVSALAQRRVSPIEVLLLAAVVSGVGYLIFAVGLNLRVTAFGA